MFTRSTHVLSSLYLASRSSDTVQYSDSRTIARHERELNEQVLARNSDTGFVVVARPRGPRGRALRIYETSVTSGVQNQRKGRGTRAWRESRRETHECVEVGSSERGSVEERSNKGEGVRRGIKRVEGRKRDFGGRKKRSSSVWKRGRLLVDFDRVDACVQMTQEKRGTSESTNVVGCGFVGIGEWDVYPSRRS